VYDHTRVGRRRNALDTEPLEEMAQGSAPAGYLDEREWDQRRPDDELKRATVQEIRGGQPSLTPTIRHHRRMVPRGIRTSGFAAGRLSSILPAAVMATAAPFPVTAPSIQSANEPRGAVETTVSAYGVRLRVRADSALLLDKLCAWLPPASRRIASADTVDFDYSVTTIDPAAGVDTPTLYVGRAGATQFVDGADEATLLPIFESLVRFDVAVATTDYVFVHAAVAAWHDAVIVIPSPSMYGKSRLVDALVTAGATYYSDEFAVIDGRGLVHPFPAPLSQRGADGVIERRPMPDGDCESPLPVRAVVATRYQPDAEWSPRRGTRGEAVLALFANTVRARIAPSHTLAVLARAVERAVLLDGARGEADAVAPLLLEVCR
jgi:hypothetical protein